jgi:hypothetical protein
MKKLVLLAGLFFAASLALAQEPGRPEQQPNPPTSRPEQQQPNPPMAAKPPASAASKDFTATVVKTDPIAKTITVKREGSDAKETASMTTDTTLPVEGKALDNLKTVNAGEKIKLTCRTDSTGREVAVTGIEKAKAEKQY